MSDDVEIDHQLAFPDQRLLRTRTTFPTRRFLTVTRKVRHFALPPDLMNSLEAEQSHAEAPFTQLLGELGRPFV